MRATDIVAYTYQAENYTPAGIIEVMIADGLAAPAARDMDADTVLAQIAAANGIDRLDEESYDSGDFPKVVFAYQMALDETVVQADGRHAVYADTL